MAILVHKFRTLLYQFGKIGGGGGAVVAVAGK